VQRLAIIASVAGALVTACSDKPAEPTTCTCTPSNTGKVKGRNADAPLTGESLLAALRRHEQDVRLKRTPRDIKVADDELRFQIIDFCQPCSDWVNDRMTMEEMFPFERLGDAKSAVCMGLVLRDGTTVYGSTRPPACR
jgi:hypothetical protein